MDSIRVIMAQLRKDLLSLRSQNGASEWSDRNQRHVLVEEPAPWLVEMGFMSPYAFVTGDILPSPGAELHSRLGEILFEHGMIDEDQLDSLTHPSRLDKSKAERIEKVLATIESSFAEGKISEEQRMEARRNLKRRFLNDPDLPDEEMTRHLAKAGATIEAWECIIQAVVRLGFVDEDRLARFLAKQLGFSMVCLREIELNLDVAAHLELNTAHELLAISIGVSEGFLHVAMADPTDPSAVDLIRSLHGGEVHVSVAPLSDVLWALKEFYLPTEDQKRVDSLDQRLLLLGRAEHSGIREMLLQHRLIDEDH
ncbi:hypothetical protein ACFL2Q_02605 [Thermodesulfobacteriota bacterium]